MWHFLLLYMNSISKHLSFYFKHANITAELILIDFKTINILVCFTRIHYIERNQCNLCIATNLLIGFIYFKLMTMPSIFGNILS